MPVKFTGAHAARLPDATAQTIRAVHDQQIKELQRLPAAQFVVVGEFTIPDNGAVTVAHRLGRKPQIVLISPPRVEFGTVVSGNGSIIDVTGNGVDRTQALRIAAFSFGAAVTVTVAVL